MSSRRILLHPSTESEKETRLDWLIELINTEDNEYQVYKALVCLKSLAGEWKAVEQLYQKNIMQTLKSVLNRDAPSLIRVVA